jgi:hypothetical protein
MGVLSLYQTKRDNQAVQQNTAAAQLSARSNNLSSFENSTDLVTLPGREALINMQYQTCWTGFDQRK